MSVKNAPARTRYIVRKVKRDFAGNARCGLDCLAWSEEEAERLVRVCLFFAARHGWAVEVVSEPGWTPGLW